MNTHVRTDTGQWIRREGVGVASVAETPVGYEGTVDYSHNSLTTNIPVTKMYLETSQAQEALDNWMEEWLFMSEG